MLQRRSPSGYIPLGSGGQRRSASHRSGFGLGLDAFASRCNTTMVAMCLVCSVVFMVLVSPLALEALQRRDGTAAGTGHGESKSFSQPLVGVAEPEWTLLRGYTSYSDVSQQGPWTTERKRSQPVLDVLEGVMLSNHVMLLGKDRLSWSLLNADGQYEEQVISEGTGMRHHALLPGERLDGVWSTVWAAASPGDSVSKLVNIVTEGPQTGETLREVYLPITSITDMAQFGDTVFAASESGDVSVLRYPEMTIEGVHSFSVSGSRVSTIHPLSENMFWVILNGDDRSEVAKVVVSDGIAAIERLQELPGIEFNQLVQWGTGYLTLDVCSGSIILLEDIEGALTSGLGGAILWENEDKRKTASSLSVINDVAFIGVGGNQMGMTGTEDAPEMVFFDLVDMEEIGRVQLSADALLYGISAAHLDERSSYKSVEIGSNLLIPIAKKGTDDAPAFQSFLGKTVDVEPILELLEKLGDDIWTIDGQETNAYYGDPIWIKSVANLKPGVDGFNLIFSNADGERDLVFKFPWWEDYFREVLQPIIDEALDPIFGKGNSRSRYERIQFAKMTPGAHIDTHYDKGGWAEVTHRVHIPITVVEGVDFAMKRDGEEFVPVELQVGKVFELDNGMWHKASNSGSQDRIHLVIDLYDGPVPDYHSLQRGETCDLSTLCSSSEENVESARR